MELYIQINFSSGLGDFFAYFYEVYFFSKDMKNKGYSINVIIHTNNKIDFKKIFKENYYHVFNSFEVKSNLTNHLDFVNYKVVNTNLNSFGSHSWELFAPIEFNEPFIFKKFINASKLDYSAILDFPKLNSNISNNIDNFMTDKKLENFAVIHFRDRDDIADKHNLQLLNNNLEKFFLDEKVSKKIENIIQNNTQVFVCSNNVNIKILLNKLYPNIITYEDDIQKTVKRTYSDHDYLNHCITEFYIMSKATKIFSFNNYNWISNFLIYGLLNSKNGPIDPNDNKNLFFESCGEF